MVTKIHHWKHGWIPLDNYARQIAAGKMKAPSAASHGIPQRMFADEKEKAVHSSLEMQSLVPGLGLPKPEEVQKNDWILNTHYSGALNLSAKQSDTLIQHLDRTNEFPATPHQDRLTVGRAGLQGSSNYTRSRDRARLISGAIKSHPDIFPASAKGADGKWRDTGGVQIPAHAVEPVLAHLRSVGAPTAMYDRLSRAASGARPDFLPFPHRVKPGVLGVPTVAKSKPKAISYSQMTPADKISAAATMYGTGSKQHLAAQKRFGGK